MYLNSVVRFQPFRLWSYPGNLAQNNADKGVLATHFNPETNSAVSDALKMSLCALYGIIFCALFGIVGLSFEAYRQMQLANLSQPTPSPDVRTWDDYESRRQEKEVGSIASRDYGRSYLSLFQNCHEHRPSISNEGPEQNHETNHHIKLEAAASRPIKKQIYPRLI